VESNKKLSHDHHFVGDNVTIIKFILIKFSVAKLNIMPFWMLHCKMRILTFTPAVPSGDSHKHRVPKNWQWSLCVWTELTSFLLRVSQEILYRNKFCIWVFSYTGLNSVDFYGFLYLYGCCKISESIWNLESLNYKLIKINNKTPFPVAASSKASACGPLDCWDCGFEFRREHGCLSVST
jgi:hypothetical protein